MTQFIYDDGGREASGYKGSAGDCTVRAIAIATQKPYQEVYDALFEMNKTANTRKKTRRGNPRGASPRDGNTCMKTIKAYMESIGWEWVALMKIGSGCHYHFKAEEMPAGRIVARLSHHMSAMIDGVIHDTYDPSYGGGRCVYGYFVEVSDAPLS
jgi:hypothetical protein